MKPSELYELIVERQHKGQKQYINESLITKIKYSSSGVEVQTNNKPNWLAIDDSNNFVPPLKEEEKHE